MSYQDSVSSSITRNTTSAEGISLDFPIFAAAHNYFFERTRSYTSWDEVRDDDSIPSGSNSYVAARLAFSQNPAPSKVFLGRRQTDTVVVTPSEDVVIGNVYSFNVIVYDATGAVVSTTAVTATAALATKASIVAIWDTLEPANTTFTVVGDTLEIVAAATYTVVVKDFVKTADSYVTTETAADLLQAIQDEDNEWYCFTAEDHSEAFQLAMAAEIEATSGGNLPKIYWTSTMDADTVVPVVDPAIDVIGKLKELGYLRTICDWSDIADTIFPEIGNFAYNSTYQPGGVNYKFMQTVGVPVAADLVTGKKLPTRIQGYIDDRNGNWMGEERGVPFYREGKVVGGEWIDIVTGSDWLNDQIEVALLNLLLNQQGGKIAFTEPSSVISTINSVLDRAVDVGFLSGYVGATIPDYLTQIPFSEKVSRILDNVKWTGYIAGAINTIIVNGNLTYEAAELV